jgi:MFS family permease
MRAVTGLIAGIFAGALAIMVVGYVGSLVYPLHSADPRDAEAVIEVLKTATAGAQAVLLLSWFAGALAGAATARAISGRAWPGWTIALLLAALLAFIFFLPLPIWMQTLAPLAPLLGGMAADLLVRLPPRPAPDSAPDVPT